MPTNTAVSSAVTPWLVQRPQALLDRFLQADLRREEAAGWIRGLIGQSALGSREYGLWKGTPGKPSEDLLRDYAKVQKFFKGLLELQAEIRSGPRSTPREGELRGLRHRLGRRLDRLVEMLGDVHLDFVRETYEGGSAENRAFRKLIVQFGRTSVRRSPLALAWTAESLVGQLSLAMAERLCGFRRSGRCPICGDVWLSVDARGNRKLCGKPTCAASWRQQRRKPEPREHVKRRVAKHRAGRRAADAR